MKTKSQEAISHIVKYAKLILENKEDLVVAIRKIAGLRYDADLELDEDLLLFIGMDDDLLHVPMGDVRKRWSKKGLEEIDANLVVYFKKMRPDLEKACKKIVKRFDAPF